MSLVLLDADILSEVLKQRNPHVLQHAANYLALHGAFTFSAMSRYEIRRGYLLASATTRLPAFENFCQHSRIITISEAVLLHAADLWVTARQQGHPSGDADIIIAATALAEGCVLATGNTRHYAWMPNLTIVDWRQSVM
ncbi:MAG: type II toxin-antitoxin system VapC family toxin [Fimbriiglobus sp.]